MKKNIFVIAAGAWEPTVSWALERMRMCGHQILLSRRIIFVVTDHIFYCNILFQVQTDGGQRGSVRLEWRSAYCHFGQRQKLIIF